MIKLLLKPNGAYFAVLYTLFMIFTYHLQRTAFYNKIKESTVSRLMTLSCIIYMALSVSFVIGLQINFILGGLMNLFTVTYLLKAISYAHVLNQVRDLIRQLKDGSGKLPDYIPVQVN